MSLKRELLIGTALFAGVSIVGGIAVAQNSAALRGYSPNEGSVPGVGIPKHNPPFPQTSPLPDIAPLASSATGSVFPTTLDGLVGSIKPTADADVAGMWTGLAKWPVVAIHANLLPNGHVLTYGTPSTSTDQNSQDFDDWDPAQGLAEPSHTVTSNQTSINSFCSASKLIANELLLVTGGNSANSTGVWNESRRQFSAVTTAPLQYPRWYASIVRLPDNRVLAVGGSDPYHGAAYVSPYDNTNLSLTPEIFTASGGWSILPGATSAEAFGALDNRFWYPRAYVAPNGSVFGISNSYLWSMSTAGNGAITPVGYLATTGGGTGGGAAATSVMYDIGKILLAGGGQRSNEEQVPASRQATVIDINRVGSNGVVAPASNDTSPMTYGRHWGTAVALPTGKVLVVGGTAYANSGANAVYAGEIWDPATGKWTTTAPAAAARLYHSTATLLLNGAVLNAGGGAGDTDSNSYFNAQVYFPPYLFTRSNGSVVWATRPTVTAVSALPAYGAAVDLTMADKSRIASVSLISLAAVTHSQSTDQRRIPLAFQQANTKLKITYPTSRAVLPPGYYQLHIVDSAGVPSTGAVIEIKV